MNSTQPRIVDNNIEFIETKLLPILKMIQRTNSKEVSSEGASAILDEHLLGTKEEMRSMQLLHSTLAQLEGAISIRVLRNIFKGLADAEN